MFREIQLMRTSVSKFDIIQEHYLTSGAQTGRKVLFLIIIIHKQNQRLNVSLK